MHANLPSPHNPTALGKAKVVCDFGLFECNRVKQSLDPMDTYRIKMNRYTPMFVPPDMFTKGNKFCDILFAPLVYEILPK